MRRRSKIPKIILASFFWAGLIYLVYKFPPDKLYLIGLFFLLLFIAFGLTLSLILGSKRYASLLSAMVIIFLLLRFLKMANILNLVLLLALTLTLGLFLRQKEVEKVKKHFPQS